MTIHRPPAGGRWSHHHSALSGSLAKIKVFPAQHIIDGLKGKLDFYIHDGQPCVRRWPRPPTGERSPGVKEGWEPFTTASKLWAQLSPSVQDAYTKMAASSGLNGRDLQIRGYLTGMYRYPHIEEEEELTKELYIPAKHGNSLNLEGDWAGYALTGAGHWAVSMFRVPSNFTSVVDLHLEVYSLGNYANCLIKLYSDYGTEGEAKDQHSEQDVATTYNLVANQLYYVPLDGVFSALAAGDLCGIRAVRATSGIYLVMGVYLKYE